MKLRKIEVPFTQVANTVLTDNELTWKAKGLFSYLASKPDGWDFAGKRITEEASDGLKSTQTGLRELEENGYLKRERQTNWRMEYVLSYEKMAIQCPEVQNGTETKRHRDKIGPISNKENISNKDKEVIDTTKVVEAKASKENITDIVEDKRDTDVQLIIDTITANHGTIDGKVSENRQYAYLLSKKIKKYPWYEKFGDVGTFVQALIKNCDKYTIGKTTSPKKMYYDLGTIIANIKAKNKDANTPKKKVTYG